MCYPCDCYDIGSHGRSCNVSSGQCHCRSGVIGRRCDKCASRFAEVTLSGCEIVYDACPRSFHSGIWWKRTPFGSVVRQDCPRHANGIALRLCNDTSVGWLEPDLSECTSDAFVNLKSQVFTSGFSYCLSYIVANSFVLLLLCFFQFLIELGLHIWQMPSTVYRAIVICNTDGDVSCSCSYMLH